MATIMAGYLPRTRIVRDLPPWSLVGDSLPNPAGKPNQDALYYTDPPLQTASGRPSALALVCDGVGGQPGGEEASALALETLRAALGPHLRREGLTAKSQQDLLAQALDAANRAVLQRNQALGRQPQKRMATTAIVAWLYDDRAVIGHVGDSRAYAFRLGEGLVRLTTDHTALELDLRRGLITLEESRAGRYRGGEALVQALGQREKIAPDFHIEPLRPGLRLLLCSDGVYKPLGEKRLARILAPRPVRFRKPDRSVDALLKQVRKAKGQDDATLALIRVTKTCT